MQHTTHHYSTAQRKQSVFWIPFSFLAHMCSANFNKYEGSENFCKQTCTNSEICFSTASFSSVVTFFYKESPSQFGSGIARIHNVPVRNETHLVNNKLLPIQNSRNHSLHDIQIQLIVLVVVG